MLENVRGMLDAVFEDYRTYIRGTLKKLGYVTDWRLLNASDFGAGMDGKWIADGTTHAAGDTCPYCGQSIKGLPLVAAYRVFFGEGYKVLKADIASMGDSIRQLFGERAIGKLTAQIAKNRGAVEFWQRYCTFDAVLLDLPESVSDDIRNFGTEALALLAGKAVSPLEPIKAADGFAAVKKAYTETLTSVAAVNIAIKAVNSLIAAKKTATGAADLKIAQTELNRLKAVRHGVDPSVPRGRGGAVVQNTERHVRGAGSRQCGLVDSDSQTRQEVLTDELRNIE
jgi:C-5 cytosine-specific DNA methylase